MKYRWEKQFNGNWWMYSQIDNKEVVCAAIGLGDDGKQYGMKTAPNVGLTIEDVEEVLAKMKKVAPNNQNPSYVPPKDKFKIGDKVRTYTYTKDRFNNLIGFVVIVNEDAETYMVSFDKKDNPDFQYSANRNWIFYGKELALINTEIKVGDKVLVNTTAYNGLILDDTAGVVIRLCSDIFYVVKIKNNKELYLTKAELTFVASSPKPARDSKGRFVSSRKNS